MNVQKIKTVLKSIGYATVLGGLITSLIGLLALLNSSIDKTITINPGHLIMCWVVISGIMSVILLIELYDKSDTE
jgi:hypothetical protein